MNTIHLKHNLLRGTDAVLVSAFPNYKNISSASVKVQTNGRADCFHPNFLLCPNIPCLLLAQSKVKIMCIYFP